MPPGWGGAGGARQGRQRCRRLPGHACSGQIAGVSRPSLQRPPPGVRLFSPQPAMWGPGWRASPFLLPSSHPNQGVLPGPGEPSHFPPQTSLPHLVSAPEPWKVPEPGRPLPASAHSGLLTSFHLVGRPWLRLPALRGHRQSWCESAPGALYQLRSRGGTIVHMGTHQHRGGCRPPALGAARPLHERGFGHLAARCGAGRLWASSSPL